MHPPDSEATPSAKADTAASARSKFRELVLKYVAFFLVSLVLATLYVRRLDHTNFVAESQAMVERWADGHFLQPPSEMDCERPDVPCHLEKLAKKLHAPQPGLEQFIFKSLTVVSISFLWFVTFQMKAYADLVLGKRGLDLGVLAPLARLLTRPWMGYLLAAVSSVPAVLFAYAMGGAYEPAVFVMALVAIYVAAEHYVSLKENEERLDDTARAIDDALSESVDKMGEALGDSAHRMGQAVDESAQKLAVAVGEVKSMTGSLLNANGIREWKSRMYQQYRQAESRIDAVVRSFDIDTTWWTAHESTCWSTYFEATARHDVVAADTLLHTLTCCRAKVQFVADLPMPHLGSMAGEQLAFYFRSLLGLAWTLVVFDEVSRHRRASAATSEQGEDAPYLRIRVSAAPAWIHVADQHTYQVIEKLKLAQSLVVQLDDDTPADKVEENRLSDWARRNVRQFAFRGAPAQEYLLSVIRWSMLSAGLIANDKRPIAQGDWERALVKLGMEEYLGATQADFVVSNEAGRTPLGAPDSGGLPYILEDSARAHCTEAFREFTERYAKPGKMFSDLERRLL